MEPDEFSNTYFTKLFNSTSNIKNILYQLVISSLTY